VRKFTDTGFIGAGPRGIIVNVLQMAKCDPLILGILETADRRSQFSFFGVAMRYPDFGVMVH